jgi:hypothetical protein
MRADATLVQLRPRPMYEAADLGVRLVQASVKPLVRCVLPVLVVLTLLCLALQPLAWWAPSLALWWCKPWLDRSLLFVLARAVFRQDSRFADLWAAQRGIWWAHLLPTFTKQRLLPWRSVTQAAQQLEGFSGKALRKRRGVLLRGHQGAGWAMCAAFLHLEAVVALGVPALLMWLNPGAPSFAPFSWLGGETPLTQAASTLSYALAIALVEPFYVGAGFAMYLNRRVEIEAWDVEQAMRHAFAPR